MKIYKLPRNSGGGHFIVMSESQALATIKSLSSQLLENGEYFTIGVEFEHHPIDRLIKLAQF
jgi:hypothetical protein